MPPVSTTVLLLGLLVAPLAPPANAQADGTSTLVVTVTRIEAQHGQVLISVFGTEGQWLQTLVYAEALAADSLQWNIGVVPYGAYAVAAIHDENNSGDLDRGGIRTEQVSATHLLPEPACQYIAKASTVKASYR